MTRADWIELYAKVFLAVYFLTLAITVSLSALVEYTAGMGR